MNSDVQKYYAENIGLVHVVARKGYNRLQAIGSTVCYDDMVQDMSVLFIRAFAMFDEKRGKFSTYFISAAFHEINKTAKVVAEERIVNGVRSISEFESEDSTFDAWEKVSDGKDTPDQILEGIQSIERLTLDLSPLARLMLDWMVNTPIEIEQELNAQRAYSIIARRGGIEKRVKDDITLGFICETLRLTKKYNSSAIRFARMELEWAVRRSI